LRERCVVSFVLFPAVCDGQRADDPMLSLGRGRWRTRDGDEVSLLLYLFCLALAVSLWLSLIVFSLSLLFLQSSAGHRQRRPSSLFIVPLDIGDRKRCFPTYDDALACARGSQRRRSISVPSLSPCKVRWNLSSLTLFRISSRVLIVVCLLQVRGHREERGVTAMPRTTTTTTMDGRRCI
jgi:hypothetical protein